MEEWKILKVITSHTCVNLSYPSETTDSWGPSKNSIKQAQAQVREAQRLGREIDARIKQKQALVAAQNAEFERECKARLAEREPEVIREAAEILARIKEHEEREKELARRRREYNRNRKKKLGNGK